MSKIFVQIASYRDPELVPTIKDCIKKAKYPEKLTFGICWQHNPNDKWDNLDEYKNNPSFTIMDVNYLDSKGLCWSRHQIQKMYKGEEYTLQIDSHHRFIKHWDDKMIKMLKQTGSKKPILTSYAGMYDPVQNKLLNEEPYKMVPSKFTESGTILFFPHAIPNWQSLKKPIKARFVSGHFFFTIGKHCEEYKYDPNIYFAGDEISLSIRSYTLGYDIFHPHKTLIWHEYTREGRVKHWDDFNDSAKLEKKVEKSWWEMDNESKRRLRHMLQEEDNQIDLGEYGLGNIRSHRDYELYAGIDFQKRKLHPDAIKGIDPPTMKEIDDMSWTDEKEIVYELFLDWGKYWKNIENQISNNEKLDFLYVGLESVDNQLLHRVDLRDEQFLTGKSTIIPVKIISSKVPYKIVVWPFEKQKGWLQRIDINL